MRRLACPAAALQLLLLVLLGRAEAACIRVDNEELSEYSCEGGSVEDLRQIPDSAEKIRVSHMPIERIDASLFSRFRNLAVLTCSHCHIAEIDDNAFRGLINLQQLSLDNNRLTEVRGAWFEGLTFLTYLDLNYNNIERVDGDVFRHAPELVDLRVSGNRLLCLDFESMAGLRELKRVFISDNPSFACPHALKQFLGERRVDFEADPRWSARDSVPVNVPATVSDPRDRWPTTQPTAPEPPSTTTTRTSTTTSTSTEPPPSPPPPRRPYVPETIVPSSPAQDFAYQGPYYDPKVTPQQPVDYRTRPLVQMPNATERVPVANVTATARNATQSTPVITTTTTECPNAATMPIRDSALGAAILLVALTISRWNL